MNDIITSRRRVLSPWTPLLGVAAILLAVGVFGVTQSVKQREAKVDQINRQILAEQQTMRVLDAEWAYLTRPQRLQDLIAMKANDGVMPPPAVMVARVDPTSEEETETKAEAAAEQPAKVAVTALAPTPVPVAVKAKVVAKAEPKTEAAPVKAAPAKVAAVQPAKKVAPVKVATAAPVAKTPVKLTNAPKIASNDYVWSPKHNDHRPMAPVMAQTVAFPKYASVKRAGVAHPIVE